MGGHILLLIGLKKECFPLSWCANKVKCVARSTMAAETLSSQEGLEDAIYHQELIDEILHLLFKIPIITYVDNRSVIEVLESTRQVDDKRLRIAISAIKESIFKYEIQLIKWCPGTSQLANSSAKKGAQSYLLPHTIQKCKIQHIDSKVYIDSYTISIDFLQIEELLIIHTVVFMDIYNNSAMTLQSHCQSPSKQKLITYEQ